MLETAAVPCQCHGAFFIHVVSRHTMCLVSFRALHSAHLSSAVVLAGDLRVRRFRPLYFMEEKRSAPQAFAFGHGFARSDKQPIANARMKQVRYRSHATYSRQPRQVRKEATVTSSCVCSEVPVPDLIFPTAHLQHFRTSDYPLLHSFTNSFRRKRVSEPSKK